MIIVVNFERGGGVWKGLEHSNQNSHSWNTCTQCYFHTSIVFYGSALTRSLFGKGLILRERWAHHLKLTLPTTTRASHKTWALPSLLCLFLSAHLNLCWKIQCSVLPLLSLNETEIFTHQHQPYMFLCYLSVEKRKQKQKDLCEIE